MTKKLNETFGFEEEEYPDMEPENVTSVVVDEMTLESGITDHEYEMEQIRKIAIKAHEDTLTTGLSIDPKMAGPLLSASTQYLDIALKASKSKVEKKMTLLKIKNPTVVNNNTQSIEGDGSSESVEGGVLLDRNQLLKSLLTDGEKNLNNKK